ncbi:hypothetical protein T4A_8804 [Trichinella pseudospiralis]|uniref:Uncharacterized protein n=1 Tax=Trichinella pseudospiralis TaxID=6337 RepID=A0A0V1E6F8_TRIPS|nr:hypothetical protein T4A_8804 [Trichinella pseudospiralis]
MANSRGERKTEHFDAACMKHGRCSKYDDERRYRPSTVSVCNLEQNASQLERTQSIQITVTIHQYLYSNVNMLSLNN